MKDIMADLRFEIKDNNGNTLTMTNKTNGDASDMTHFLSSVYNYVTDSYWCRSRCKLQYKICNFNVEYGFNVDSNGDMQLSSLYDFLLGCTYHKDVANDIVEGVASGKF